MLDARLARGLDGGRCFVEAFFEQSIFRSGQQALVDFGQAGARRFVGGVLCPARRYSSSALSPAGARSADWPPMPRRRAREASIRPGRMSRIARHRRRHRNRCVGSLCVPLCMIQAAIRIAAKAPPRSRHETAGIRALCSGRRRCGAPPLVVIFLDGGIGKQLRPAGRHGLVDESIDGAGADQSGERDFRVPIAGDHHHEIGELPLDLPDEYARRLVQGLHIEHQNAHFDRRPGDR